MNTYFDYLGSDELERRPRLEGSMAMGNAIGSLVTATFFGLTRAVAKTGPDARRSTARVSANDELILDASGWR